MSDAVESTTTEKTVWENREPTETEVNPASETKTDSDVFDREYVESIRKEAADWRTRLRKEQEEREKLAEKVAEFERAQLSEDDRRKKDFEDAKSENRKLKDAFKETLLEAAVAKNTVKFELADADATLQLLDKKTVEYGEDGRPQNMEDVLTATLEKYPFLKAAAKRQPVDPGATNPGRQRKGGSLTKEAVQNMSHEERAERMPEILKWAQNGYK
jgi:hypothetical protein